MLINSIRKARARIASLLQRSNAYLQNERTRQVSNKENAETGCILFLLVIVLLLAQELQQTR